MRRIKILYLKEIFILLVWAWSLSFSGTQMTHATQDRSSSSQILLGGRVPSSISARPERQRSSKSQRVIPVATRSGGSPNLRGGSPMGYVFQSNSPQTESIIVENGTERKIIQLKPGQNQWLSAETPQNKKKIGIQHITFSSP